MKIVFFGSSEFSIPVLEAILSSKYAVSQVITTPDRKKGRGQKIASSIVKTFSEERRLPVLTPEKLSMLEVVEKIKRAAPDFLIIASYGKMVPKSIFSIPKIASLNVHPSLLPKYRGASPIQSAILNGDTETGVSIAEVTSELDSGDIFAQMKTKIGENENAFELSDRLSKMAGKLLLEVIHQFEAGKISRTSQDSSKSVYAGKINKEAGKIDWRESAIKIHNQIRAYYPWPGALTLFHGKRLKILKAQVVESSAKQEKTPGTILKIDSGGGIQIQTQTGILELLRLQPEGRREMSASEFARGERIKEGDRFESQ